MTVMQLSYRPHLLALRHAFGIASNTRTSTPVMFVEIAHEGLIGYGEASMPPYLGENHETAAAFLAKVDLGRFADPLRLEEILPAIDAIGPGNAAAKAALDIALHDLVGKKLGAPWHRIWGLDPTKVPPTSFTIGIDTPEVVRAKTREAAPYRILKIKLGRDAVADRELVTTIREITDTPLSVDANQGWTNRNEALKMIEWLAGQNVLFVEQPLPKAALEDTAWLRERSPLPLVADESCQRLADVAGLRGVFDGINIKLMKCTGLREAHKMVTVARALGLKVMLGCMTETSCAISAAAQLAPLADWADLDGALLIKDDPFDGAMFSDGRVLPNDRPGIGIVLRSPVLGPH